MERETPAKGDGVSLQGDKYCKTDCGDGCLTVNTLNAA